jgi:hypothetical protein
MDHIMCEVLGYRPDTTNKTDDVILEQERQKLVLKRKELEERETHLITTSALVNQKRQNLATLEEKLMSKIISADPDLADFKQLVLNKMQHEYTEAEKRRNDADVKLTEKMKQVKEIEESSQLMLDEVFRHQELVKKFKEQASVEMLRRTDLVTYAKKKLDTMGIRVRLNFSGRRTFEVSLNLLISCENCIFPALLSEEVIGSIKKIKETELFFDEDPKMFEYVLEYIKYGRINYPYKKYEDFMEVQKLMDVLNTFKILNPPIYYLDDMIHPKLSKQLDTQLTKVLPFMFYMNLMKQPTQFKADSVMEMSGDRYFIKLLGHCKELQQGFYVFSKDLSLKEFTFRVNSVNQTEIVDEGATRKQKENNEFRQGNVMKTDVFLSGVLIDEDNLPLSVVLNDEIREKYQIPIEFKIERLETTIDLSNPSYVWKWFKVIDNYNTFVVNSEDYHLMLKEL